MASSIQRALSLDPRPLSIRSEMKWTLRLLCSTLLLLASCDASESGIPGPRRAMLRSPPSRGPVSNRTRHPPHTQQRTGILPHDSAGQNVAGSAEGNQHQNTQGDQLLPPAAAGPHRRLMPHRRRTPEQRTLLDRMGSSQDADGPPEPVPPARPLASGAVGSLNVLASFAGKNRVLVITAPHDSDGYYRLLTGLLGPGVYCEMAERHMHQVVLFHQEGREGGRVRRVSAQGQVTEETLDAAVVPRLMSLLKLERGRFSMVLLRKNLQVEERYPYPVRLEAVYEAVDQTPGRRAERARQKGFVQRCKAAGLEGTLKDPAGPGGSSMKMPGEGGEATSLLTTRQTTTTTLPTTTPTTTTTRSTTTRRPARTRSTTTTPPTTSATTTATTTTTATRRGFIKRRRTTTTTRAPTATKPTTTTKPPTTTAAKPRTKPTTTTKPPTTTKPTTTTTPMTTIMASTATPEAPSSIPPLTATMVSRESSGPQGHSDARRQQKQAVVRERKRPGQEVLADPLGPSDDEEEIEEVQSTGTGSADPGKKGRKVVAAVAAGEVEDAGAKRATKPNRKNKAEKKKRKMAKEEVPPPPHARKSGKKGVLYQENHDGDGPSGKLPKAAGPLTTFFGSFEKRRRLLVITTPSDENRMYTQQRDEYLENVCEMAVRKLSIITIFGTWNNGTMKIDHYQLEQDQSLKGVPQYDLTNQELIRALRKELGLTFNEFYMVLTDYDMRAKDYEVPIAMKAVLDYVDTFSSRIAEMEKQQKQGVTCEKEDKSRSLENFLSRFRWRRRIFIISTPDDEEWAYQQQMYSLASQTCNLGLRHMSVLKLAGREVELMGGTLELYPINGSSSVEREELSAALVGDIRNYFQVSAEYFSMLLVGKDGNVKSWYPSPMWSMAPIYDLVDSMQLRRQEMAIQQSLGMRCPDDGYGDHGYHGHDPDGYGHRGYGY